MNQILEAAQFVAENSRHVTINHPALLDFTKKLCEKDINIPPWDAKYHFLGEYEETVAYLLVLDTINFCFWQTPGESRWEIGYDSKQLSGYYALAASLKQAVESGKPITNAGYLADLTLEQLRQLLGGQGELLLLDQRLQNLNELGQTLIKEYDGQAFKLVQSAEGSAISLVKLLAEKLSSYQDIAAYQGREILFYKRAQLFAADLYGAFAGKQWGNFHDIDQLTAFADYKLPQVLRHLGIIAYDETLSNKVDNQAYIEAGSSEEVEIRANTIWAVELIQRQMAQAGVKLRSFEIDWVLWNMGQEDTYRKKPYHRTLTIFY